MVVVLRHKYLSSPKANFYDRVRISMGYHLSVDTEVEREHTLLCVCNHCRTEMAAQWYFPVWKLSGPLDKMNHNQRDEYIASALAEASSRLYRCSSSLQYEERQLSEAKQRLKEFNKYSISAGKDALEKRISAQASVVAEYRKMARELPEYVPYLERELALGVKEYHEFLEMKTCPICHCHLENGFFAIYSWSEWDKQITAYLNEKLTQQEIEQVDEIDIAEKDIEDTRNLMHGESFHIEDLCRFWIGNRYINEKRIRDNINEKLDSFSAGIVIDKEKCPQKQSVLSSPDHLKEYIHHLFTIETNIYSVGKRLTELYMQQSYTESSILQRKGLLEMESNEKRLSFNEKRLSFEKVYNDAMTALDKVRSTEPVVVYNTNHIPSPIKPTRPILREPGLFNKKKVLTYNAEVTAKYQEACDRYQQLLDKYESDCNDYRIRAKQRAEEQHAQLILLAEKKVEEAKAKLEQCCADFENQMLLADKPISPETAVQALLEKEIAQAEKTYKELCKCRQQLYDADVVFFKYRDIVALATFYEYLASGRCRSLEGENGAYNLYETECRTQQIIGQLSKIVNSLEEIKNTQYLLYSELRHINSNLNTMNSTMNNMAHSLQKVEINTNNTSAYMKAVAQNTEVIAYNTAATAYYSKVNAELTNSLGYLIALN